MTVITAALALCYLLNVSCFEVELNLAQTWAMYTCCNHAHVCKI